MTDWLIPGCFLKRWNKLYEKIIFQPLSPPVCTHACHTELRLEHWSFFQSPRTHGHEHHSPFHFITKTLSIAASKHKGIPGRTVGITFKRRARSSIKHCLLFLAVLSHNTDFHERKSLETHNFRREQM